MMSEDNRMDDLLRKRLEQFSAQPPERVWQGIRASVQMRESPVKTKYFRWLAAAAVLLIAVVSGVLHLDDRKEIATVVTESSLPDTRILPSADNLAENEKTPAFASSEIPQSSYRPDVRTFSKEINSELQPEVTEQPKSEITYKPIKKIELKLQSGFEKSVITLNNSSEIISAESLTDFDKKIIAENIIMGSADENLSGPGWKLGMHLSPGYSSHKASHSAGYSSNMTYADTDARANMGAGFSLQYKTGHRWSVETGMYYAKTGGSSGNSFRFSSMQADFADAPLSAEKYFNTGVTNQMGQLAMNSTAGVILFSRPPTNAELISMPEASFGLSTAMLTPGEFQQVFEFIEIPLLARYRIVDSGIALEWVGGISTNILAGNSVYMESGSGRERVGTTQDISTFNFSGTTGVGLIYAMGKNLSLSVEPRFSYYLNSINHSGDVNFKPWRVGIFTGLSYEF